MSIRINQGHQNDWQQRQGEQSSDGDASHQQHSEQESQAFKESISEKATSTDLQQRSQRALIIDRRLIQNEALNALREHEDPTAEQSWLKSSLENLCIHNQGDQDNDHLTMVNQLLDISLQRIGNNAQTSLLSHRLAQNSAMKLL